MTTDVAVTTLPSADTPGTAICLRHERGSYLFGHVAEGTQRVMGARGTPINGIGNVFLSGSVGWDKIGGLPGLLLTIGGVVSTQSALIAENNKERARKGQRPINRAVAEGVNVHAGENITHALATQRGIIQRQPIKAEIYEHRGDPRAEDPENLEPDWHDEFVKVWKVPVARERSSSPKKRLRLDDSAADEEHKEPSSLSDPEIANFIIHEHIWNAKSMQGNMPLVCREIHELKPEDTAIVFENGTPKLYKGPYSVDGGALPNAHDEAWLWQPDVKYRKESGERTLSVESPDRLPLPRTTYSRTSMSYIVKTADRRGKFDVKAAQALGVRKADYSALTQMREVTNESGEIVKPEQVLGEPIPGKGFAVADISGPDFIESFVARPEWFNKQMMANVVAIYWLLAPGLATHPKIKKMMDDLPDTRHIICSSDACPNQISLAKPAELQMMLRRIDPARYPIPQYQNQVALEVPDSKSNIHFARAGNKIHLMPRLVMDDEKAETVSPFINLEQAYNRSPTEALNLALDAKEKTEAPDFLKMLEEKEKDIPNRDAEITCLGTGSSAPSKYRNVAGTLIRVPGIGNYLLDCGEGTLGQMRRLYGLEEVANILRDLKCIVISHLHADHHLGTISVVRAWYEQTIKDGSNAKLAISCIDRYEKNIREISQIEDFGFHRLVFPMHTGNDQYKDYLVRRAEDFKSGEPGLAEFGLSAIKQIAVPHCWRSLAHEIELTSGLRVAYSGDTIPCDRFAEKCRGAHLLVHECTFQDDMLEDARKKQHSTVSGALSVSKSMQARRTLLTHFSQRYVKADVAKMDSMKADGVLMGMDFMSVKLGDFQKAALYVPAVHSVMDNLGGTDDDVEPSVRV